MNSLDVIDEQMRKAAQPKPSRKPTFLFLKEGHKAVVRPLMPLDQVLIMAMHHKYHKDFKQSVNAACAKEADKDCVYCEQAAHDKKLTAGVSFMLPVYIYNITDVNNGGKQVTYTTEDSEEKPVSGIRVLEMTVYGYISQVLKVFREHSSEGGSISSRDFTIEKIATGYTTVAKDPKLMNPKLKELTPTNEQVKQRIIEACPPVVVFDGATASSLGAASEVALDDDDMPKF